MGLPDRLLPHTVTKVRAATEADAYGNLVANWGAATRTEIKAWLQQNMHTERYPEGRDVREQLWLLMTNHDDIASTDRIEWAGQTYEVWGQPEPAYTPRGYHHVEVTLRVLEG